jgi:hypothetical protein
MVGPAGAQQRHLLRSLGFTIGTASSLLDVYTQASQRLDPRGAMRPIAILLDLCVHEPGFPELTASLIIADLAFRMRLGTLHPAWLIGFSAESMPEQESEALVAGCHRLLHTPLTEDILMSLRTAMEQPAPIPHSDITPEASPAIRAYQNAARRVIEAVRTAHVQTWTAEDIRALLVWLTRYPFVRRSDDQRQPNPQVRAMLRMLGGSQGAYQRLQMIAEQWQSRYPLHSAILQMFLAGQERRDIVRFFVAQDLYEDSRIYVCIKELPRRIAEQLRFEQANDEDADVDRYRL